MKFSIIFCVHLVLFGHFELLNAQGNCFNLSDITPTNRNIYMIGEFHLDHVEPTPESINSLQKTIAAEDSIRTFLVNNCGVTRFMLEAPVSFEYFFNQFIHTGDTSWLSYFTEQPYQIAKLLSIRELAKTNPNITINCIDIDYEMYTIIVLQTIYAITFYEPFKILFSPPYTKENYYPPYNNFAIGKDLIQSGVINDTLASIFDFFIDETIHYSDSTKDYLYAAFSYIQNSPVVKSAMKKYYGANYDYIAHVMYSYANGYGKTFASPLSLLKREDVLSYTVSTLINANPNDKVCIQMGGMHLNAADSLDMTRHRIENITPTRPFCFFMVQPENLSYYIEAFKHPNTPNFNFKGNYCIAKFSENDVNVFVK